MRFLAWCAGCVVAIGFVFIILLVIVFAIIGSLSGQSASYGGGAHAAAIVRVALTMAPHLHNCPPENLDQCWDSGFPQQVISYWQQECPGCAAWQNGDLQCVMFDVAAYGLAGDPLPVVSNAVDFWNNYQDPELRAKGWIEIPNGTGMPMPGDMVIMSSPYFGGVGHMTIVTDVRPPVGGRDGSLTFAQANGPGALNTFPLPPNLRLQTWTNYTVLGFIRHIVPGSTSVGPGLPTNLPDSPYVQLAYQDAQNAGIPPAIFVRQINAESHFDPRARSAAGAEGIAQIMPAVAQTWGVDPWNPTAALQAAAQHMARYYADYGGDAAKALAAYNAGEGAVNAAVAEYGSAWLEHMPGETQQYVNTILHTP